MHLSTPLDLDRESFTGIIDNLFDGLYLVDRNRRVTYWNKAAERISGFRAQEVIGKQCSESILTHVDASGSCLCEGNCPFEAAMLDGQPRDSELFLRHKDGHRIPVAARISALTDGDGRVIGGIEQFTDISDQHANAIRIQELERIALLDGLTRLANRHYLEREIERRFAELRRYGLLFGVLFLDIDHFKKFNDTHGHVMGDRALQFVAKTLVANSRPFDLFGRWGGEEFLGVIHNVNQETLAELGERLRVLVESSYLPHQRDQLRVTVSIGATMVREDDSDESLLARADGLMYASKRSGRNQLTLG